MMINIVIQIPKDWFLFVIVLLVVAVDLLIITIGTAIPSSRLNATLAADIQHPKSVDVSINCFQVVIKS